MPQIDKTKRIELIAIIKQANRLKYVFTYSEELGEFFSGNEFYIDYPTEVDAVPFSIAAIPFVCSVLPIIWLTDSKLYIPELDKEFLNCLDSIKQGYVDIYPEVKFMGEIISNEVENAFTGKERKHLAASFFSGGVDATTTLIRHIDEKPLLITLWGSDVRVSNTREWESVYATLQRSANLFSLPICYIKSSFRNFDRENVLDSRYHKTLGTGWWYGVKHGIGLIGHAAPLVWLYGIENLYIASSNCPEDGPNVKCASDPRIDNQVRFCGCRVFHDGFELNRQKKVQYLVNYRKAHPNDSFELHVCWESHTGGNCCRCEKCYRTMAELWIEGEDPKDYGFSYTKDVFWKMYKHVALQHITVAPNTWTYSKKCLCDNWDRIKKKPYGRKIKWICRYDFHNPNNNLDKRIFMFLKSLKRKLKRQ